MAISQALTCVGTFGATHSKSFTADFVTHADAAGSNPSSGSYLVVLYFGSANCTAIDTNQSDVGTEVVTQDNSWQVFLISNIQASVTQLDITKATTGTERLFCFEIDEEVALNFTAAYAASGEGSATAHDLGYTTDEDGSYAFAGVSNLLSGRTWTGASGSSVLTEAASDTRGVVYKAVTTAETGTLDWTFDSNSTASGLVCTFEPPAAGGPISILVDPAGTPY